MNYDLPKYRMKDSKEKFKYAKELLKLGGYKDSISRSYYAMFSAARALLATKNLDSAKHAGVISFFNQHFVKPGIVKKDMGRMLARVKLVREESDYGDFIIISKEEAEKQLNIAKEFIQEIKRALEEIIKNETENNAF